MIATCVQMQCDAHQSARLSVVYFGVVFGFVTMLHVLPGFHMLFIRQYLVTLIVLVNIMLKAYALSIHYSFIAHSQG